MQDQLSRNRAHILVFIIVGGFFAGINLGGYFGNVAERFSQAQYSSGLFCEKAGSICEDFYTESCTTQSGATGIKNCHSTGRCRAQGDKSECSFDLDALSCSDCVEESTASLQTLDTTESSSCQHIIGTGATRVLFIPYEFNSEAEFSTLTSQAIDNIRSTNFGDLYNNFSFIAYNKFDGSYGCHDGIRFPGGTQFGCQDEKAVKQAMAECQANGALVIANVPGLGGYSNSGSGFASIKKGTVTYSAHELGHAIATLDDEYPFNRATKRKDPGPNCSISSTCAWQTKYPTLGCISGCGFSNWYKPTEKSVMNKNSNKNNEWNLISLDAWEKAMKFRTLSYIDRIEKYKREYHKSLFINVQQTQLKELSVGEIRIDNTYPVELDQNLTHDYYKITMYNDQKEILYSGQVAFSSHQVSESDVEQEVIKQNLILNLPFYTSLYSVVISDEQNQTKLEINLDDFGLTIPPPLNNLCGNGVCDSRIGENVDSCFADCKPQNGYRENYKQLSSDINKDGITNIIDCGICLQEYRRNSPFIKCDIMSDYKVDVLDYSACINNLGKVVEHAPDSQL